MRHLTDVTFKNDSLTVFPNILKYLQQVRRLSLEGNNLDVIGDTSIQMIVPSNVEDIDLRNCNLNRVPDAIFRMKNLHILDISQNHIHTFELNDFTSMRLITNLTVFDNPLSYIYPDAFNELRNLIYLNLQNTSLTEMPNAIQNSPWLQDVILPKGQISCTFDLKSLKEYNNLNGPNLHVQGTCETMLSEIENHLN